jgi:hypothetical protein
MSSARAGRKGVAWLPMRMPRVRRAAAATADLNTVMSVLHRVGLRRTLEKR